MLGLDTPACIAASDAMNPKSPPEDLAYSVPGIGCGHRRVAIVEEVNALPGVADVEVDLAAKRLAIRGTGLDDHAVRAAIAAGGYEVGR
jgi:copper chaperone